MINMKSISTIILCEALCLLGFITVQADPGESAAKEPCPEGWIKLHRGCYKFFTNSEDSDGKTWKDALTDCNQISGNLTSIQSLAEKEELETYLSAFEPDTKKWWVGLRRSSESGTDWIWLDDYPLETNVLPWTNEQLRSRTGSYCGMIDTSKGIQISVTRCTTTQSFICEYHRIDMSSNGVTSTTLKPRDHGDSITVTNHYTSPQTDVSTSPVTFKSDSFTSISVASNEDITTTNPTSTTVNPDASSHEVQNDGGITEGTVNISRHTSDTTILFTNAQIINEMSHTNDSVKSSSNPFWSTSSTSESTTSTSTQTTTIQPITTTTATATTITTTTTTTTTENPTQPEIPKPTMVDWDKELEAFDGCYIPGTGESLRETVMDARKFYNWTSDDENRTCPEVRIGNILWPKTKAGKTAEVKCAKGNGFATFHCGDPIVCWRGHPDITGCASKKLQYLLRTVESPDSEVTMLPPSIEESVEVSNQLVHVTRNEETTMEDVMVTSQVMTALTQRTEKSGVMNQTQVKDIVDNVVKVGSNLVSTNKSAMWEEMSQEDKVRSASTLLVAMEKATVSMAAEIEEPTVIVQKSENIELELHVVDMAVLEKEEKKELVYGSSHSDSSFSIPMETLKSFSTGNLAKAVFMTHYSMSDILGGHSKKQKKKSPGKPKEYDLNKNQSTVEVDFPKESSEEDKDVKETGPKIASYILSASLGVERSITKLPKPITFTMRHLEEIDGRYTPLCSFWNVSHDIRFGFWAQDGCRFLRTNRSFTTCECDHMTNFAILLDVHGFEVSKEHQSLLHLATIIGCAISCVSLLASWITFQCFTSLQGERNSIHKNLAFTLLLAEILFVFGIDQTEYKILCSVIAGFLHFFFLAAFTWMFIEGLHIIFMLVQVFDASRSRLPYYYLTGYGVPFTVVGASCLFYYGGYENDKFCWLKTDKYFIWAFAGPVALILLVNAFFLTYAMSTVCRHSDYVFSAKEKTTISGIRSWIQGALALEVLLGLTWTIGYFLIDENSVPLAYIFAILNSLQGLFIFVFHCLLNKKAQKEYRQMARTMVRRSTSGVTTHTHSTLTKRNHHTNHSHSPTNSHQKLNAANDHSLA